MKVIIVDDHAVVRMGLRAVLENAGGMSVVADFARAEDAINWLRAHPVDLVIMDLRFKQTGAMDGTSAVRAIKQMGGPPVLVVTTYGSEPEILGALAAGAAGYVLKDADTGELQRAVVAAAHGEQFLGSGVEAQIKHRGMPELTGREMDVLRLVAQGKTNAAVAKALFLSEATVKTHLNRVFEKLAVNSRTAAVAKARSVGLLEE
ncbi:response regulator transcription factor [uncultured Actinomyces sp.]|uniref:response regulator transcription factor n=1 Tax=uncultured Actinomyces sp. TaxID=249061 RepID=UPI0026252005|nr:response regulator transcription factor [uncultured Actinomyces sp.]